MQKRLLVAAVAGALAVPGMALAAGGGSTVQIYGQAEWEHAYLDQGDGRPSTHYNEVSGSYVGVKGTENLGGGLSAWFQCETTMDIRAVDQTGLCSRNSGLGFKGGFGNVWVGRWHTPMSRAVNYGFIGGNATGTLGVSYLPSGGSGSVSAMASGAYTAANNGGSQTRRRFKRRETCLTTYETPRMGGFMVGAAISCGNRAAEAGGARDADNNANPYIWSLAGTYVNGPLRAFLSYEKHLEMGTFGPGNKELDDDGWALGGRYKLGNVTFGGYYMAREWEQPDGNIKKNSVSVGFNWNVAGPHSIEGNYAWLDDSKGSSKTPIEEASAGGIAAPGADTGAQSYTLGYVYRFSKRTRMKLGWTRMDNDANSRSARLGPAASVLKRGDTQDSYALIMWHRF